METGSPSELAPSEMLVSDVEDGLTSPGPQMPSFPPYPPYATEPAPPSLADTIIAGRGLRQQHKPMPRKAVNPPPKPARPRGPKATDVKMTKRAMRAHARCLRRHGAILTDRLERMSKPRRRTIIYFWREYARMLPPETIARLRSMLNADEPFKPDQAYEYFVNLKKTKKKTVATERINEIKKDVLAMCGEKRFIWARNATVAFARGIQQRLSRPGRYALADRMLRLSNIILDEVCGYMHMRTPSRRSQNPKAKFMMEISDKVAVWIDEILSESDDRMLMMDFDEDEDIKADGAGDAGFTDDFLDMMGGGGPGSDGSGRRLGRPKSSTELGRGHQKFSGNMQEAFNILTDTMEKKGDEPLLSHGKFNATYKEGAATLQKAHDLAATDYNTSVAADINKKLSAATKGITPKNIAPAMKDMVEIGSSYLAQNAEENKDKGPAFQELVKALHNNPNEKLYQKGKIERTNAEAATELEKAKSLETDHDDPNLTESLRASLKDLVDDDTPIDSKKDMDETLDISSKYLSQKAVDANERGPAFDILIKELEKDGGEHFTDNPALPTKYTAAYTLKTAPGLESVAPDPATAPGFQKALHKSVDHVTPKEMHQEMNDVVNRSANYLSGFIRDRDAAKQELVAMMKSKPKHIFATRNNYTMDYETAAKELETAPILVPYLPVKDIADEGKACLTKDVIDTTGEEPKTPMKAMIQDASKCLSQSVAMRSGAAGERYPMNFLASVKKSLGSRPLFKTKYYGQTYAEAADVLQHEGPMTDAAKQDPADEATTNLRYEITSEMKRAVPTRLAPTVVEDLQPTMDNAAQLLANTGSEKMKAMGFLVDLMDQKGDAPLVQMQGYQQTYSDAATRIKNAVSLQSDKVDKKKYEDVKSKLSALTAKTEKPQNIKDESIPEAVNASSKFLAKPMPETISEKRQILSDIVSKKGDDILAEDGLYKISYKETGEEIMKSPVGVTKAEDEAKKKEIEQKMKESIPNEKMTGLLKDHVKEGSAHLADVVKGRGEAMQVIHDDLKTQKDKEFINVGEFKKTHEQVADMVEKAPTFDVQKPSPVILDKVEGQVSKLPKEAPADKPMAKEHMEDASKVVSTYIAGTATKDSGLNAEQLAALDASGFTKEPEAAGGTRQDKNAMLLGPDGKPILGPDGKPYMLLMGPDGKPVLGPDGKPIVLGPDGKPILLGPDGKPILGPDGKPYTLLLGPDGKPILGPDGKPIVLGPDGKPILIGPDGKPILGPNGKPYTLLLGPDGKPVLGPDGKPIVLGPDGKPILIGPDGKPILGPNGKPYTLLMGPDGKPILGPDGKPIVLGPDGKPILLGPDGKPILGPDGKPVALSLDEKPIAPSPDRKPILGPDTKPILGSHAKPIRALDEKSIEPKFGVSEAQSVKTRHGDKEYFRQMERAATGTYYGGALGADYDPEHAAALDILHRELRERGSEVFYQQPQTSLSHVQASDWLAMPQPMRVDKTVRESGDTARLHKKFERKISALTSRCTPPDLLDCMQDVVIESARRLSEFFVSTNYKGLVHEALISEMQKRGNEILTEIDGAAETYFFAAQRLKKSKIMEVHEPCYQVAYELTKKLDDMIRTRSMPRKLTATMKEHVKEAADFLSGLVTKPDDQIEAYVALLGEMEAAGDSVLIDGNITKSYKDAAAYFRQLTSFEDQIKRPNEELKATIQSKLKKLMANVTPSGYSHSVMDTVIAESAGLLTSFKMLQEVKTEALGTLVKEMEQAGDNVLLRHGPIRKDFLDGAVMLRGKNTDEVSVNTADPVVARKIQIKLTNLMQHKTPEKHESVMDDVIEDATMYLAVHFLKPQLMQVCKCMKNVFVQCELWWDEILRRVGRPCCKCSRHVSTAAMQDLARMSSSCSLFCGPGSIVMTPNTCPSKLPPVQKSSDYNRNCPAANPSPGCQSGPTTSYYLYSAKRNRQIGYETARYNMTSTSSGSPYSPYTSLSPICVSHRTSPLKSLLADIHGNNVHLLKEQEQLDEQQEYANPQQKYTEQHEYGEPEQQRYERQHEYVEPAQQQYKRQHEYVKREQQRYETQHEYAQPEQPLYERQHKYVEPEQRRFERQHEYVEPEQQRYERQHEYVEPDQRRYERQHEYMEPEQQRYERQHEYAQPEQPLYEVPEEYQNSQSSSTAFYTPDKLLSGTSQGTKSDSFPYAEQASPLAAYYANVTKSESPAKIPIKLITQAKTGYNSRTPIISTDQMADWHALMVSLMWNLQAWRDWIQENIDRALVYQHNPNVPKEEMQHNWSAFQRRLSTEALQWRQYSMFSRQLTTRLALRYRDKQIVSPVRATVKTKTYLECQEEMLEIIDMFNRWTQWLTLVVKETDSLHHNTNSDMPLYELRWHHLKKKVEEYARDWAKYNLHLKVSWEQKYSSLIAEPSIRDKNQRTKKLFARIKRPQRIMVTKSWMISTQYMGCDICKTDTVACSKGPQNEIRFVAFEPQNSTLIHYKAHTQKNKIMKDHMPSWTQPGPVWVVSACGAVPSGAVAAGVYDGEVIWVARTTHRCKVLPAALYPSKHCCLVYSDGGIHNYTKYQVMCNAEVRWVAWRGGSIAGRAVRVAPGVHVGRVTYRGDHLLGAVHEPHYRCQVVIFGRPFAFNCYELLMLAEGED